MRIMTINMAAAIAVTVAVVGGWQAMAAAQTPAGDPLILASKGGPATVLLAAGNDASMKRAVETWRAFLKDRGFDVQVVPPSEKPDLPQAGAVIAFETESACPLAKQVGIDLAKLKDARGESHIIVVQEWNHRPCVLVVGKASAGADCGAGRLLSLVRSSSDKVTCRALREARKPFFNVRDMHLAAEGENPGCRHTIWFSDTVKVELSTQEEQAGKLGNFEWWDDHDRLLGIGKQ